MFDMSSMMSAKKKADVNQEDTNEKYENLIQKGMQLYEQFNENQNEAILKEAADCFFEALFIKRTSMEPYLFLSMIFYLFDEEDKAREYFDIAGELAPELEGMAEFMENVSQLIYGHVV